MAMRQGLATKSNIHSFISFQAPTCPDPCVAAVPALNPPPLAAPHSMKPNGQLEERSLHTACPVIRGQKWSMPKWIHAQHYVMGDKYDRELDAQLQAEKELEYKIEHHEL